MSDRASERALPTGRKRTQMRRTTGASSARLESPTVKLFFIFADRRVQALVPGSILARRQKRQAKRHKKATPIATRPAVKKAA